MYFEENVGYLNNSKYIKELLDAYRYDDKLSEDENKERLNKISNCDVWPIIYSYFEECGLVKCQLDSYNYYINVGIPSVFDCFKKVSVDCGDEKYIVELGEHLIIPPRYERQVNDKEKPIFPINCIHMKCPYEAKIYIDVTINNVNSDTKTFYPKHYIGPIPVMKMSDICNVKQIEDDKFELGKRYECLYDQGGYFIVDGGEGKYIVPQERTVYNRVCVYPNRKSIPKYEYYSDLRSCNKNGFHSTSVIAGYMRDRISVVIQWIDKSNDIPLVIIFCALGVKTYDEIIRMIFNDYYFDDSVDYDLMKDKKFLKEYEKELDILKNNFDVRMMSQTEALLFIGRSGKKRMDKKDMDDDEINIDVDNEEKEVEVEVEIEDEEEDIGTESAEKNEGDEEEIEEDEDGNIYHEIKADTYSQKDLKKMNVQDIPTLDKKDMDFYNYALYIMKSEFLPHMGNSFEKKAHFFAYMVKRIIFTVTKKNKVDDRDHYSNKRLANVGLLLITQFYNTIRKMISDMIKNAKNSSKTNKKIDLISYITDGFVKKFMSSCLKKSSFLNIKGAGTQSISRSLERHNYIGGLSGLRKTCVPMDKNMDKIIKPRFVHGISRNRICPWETPEGKGTGMLKNMALPMLPTVGYSAVELYPIVYKILKQIYCSNKDYKQHKEVMRDARSEKILKYAKLSYKRKIYNIQKKYDVKFKKITTTILFIYGKHMCLIPRPELFVAKLIELRRKNFINYETSCSYVAHKNVVEIHTDGGRTIRPVMVLYDGKPKLTKTDILDLYNKTKSWNDLLENGVIEYLDSEEEESMLLRSYPEDCYTEGTDAESSKQYTHCELHPSLMVGVGGSTIPFPDHNQSPRNTYQCSMAKQAIGTPSVNWRYIQHGSHHIMRYPMKPMCITRNGYISKFHKLPSGQPAMTSITPFEFNQEDAVEINLDSMDRGFMTIDKVISYSAVFKNEDPGIPSPDVCVNIRGKTDKLDIDGLVAVGDIIINGDTIIGKLLPLSEVEMKDDERSKRYKDTSILYEEKTQGVVDTVQVGSNIDGHRFVTVTIIQKRMPIVGDKFAAMPGQKGIMGMGWKSIDLPFDRTGKSPDLLLNSLAFPSRMTIGTLIEGLMGCIISNTSSLYKVTMSDLFSPLGMGDCTPFISKTGVDIEALNKEMRKYGNINYGDTQLTDGMTGLPMLTLTFMCPIYYQRLKHMVDDKYHARGKGGRSTLFHQPRDGRKQSGGHRIGLLERDSMFSQGCTNLIRDRLMEQSDEFKCFFCDICGLMSKTISKDGKLTSYCDICQTNKCSLVKLPYATKTVIQELMALNIVPRTLTSKY
jgi:DNA-directed RNA polymerase II subunit RPB2